MQILVVDDHAEVRESLGEFLRSLGHEVSDAGSGQEALQVAAKQHPALVITDLRMPGMDGLHLLAALEGFEPRPACVLMTAFGDASTAVEAMRLGAVDYLRKPIDVREVHRLLERLDVPDTTPATALQAQPDGLIIAGPAMAKVVALADRLHTAQGLPCLIEAETGCGKELLAHRIHHGGKPDRRPFVAVNCAAIPHSLFEAELFGHAPGAFTGAAPGGAVGKLEAAAEGTVFLDEIGELALDQQAKLLRVLETRTFYPVGSTKLVQLKARIVCATNRSLVDLVQHGGFREDLLYRLKVGYLRIPPLRERRDEIPVLARLLLSDVRRRLGRGFHRITASAEQTLTDRPWPGNVRELRHELESLGVVHDGETLEAWMVNDATTPSSGVAVALAGIAKPPPRGASGISGRRSAIGSTSPVERAADVTPLAQATTAEPGAGLLLPSRPPADLRLGGERFALDDWHRAIVVAALATCRGSPVKTADYLGISRKVLYTLRRRYDLLDPGDSENLDDTAGDRHATP